MKNWKTIALGVLTVGVLGALPSRAVETVVMPLGAPEFGYSIVNKGWAPGVIIGGESTVTTVIPPDVKKLENYARGVTTAEDLRVKAVDTIATLTASETAARSLERIATKIPLKSSSSSSTRVAARAIAGLGESTIPSAKIALEKITTGKAKEFQKVAAKAALERMAQKAIDDAPGYW